METRDLILDKARFEDWEELYRGVWSRPETARYMLWRVTPGEAEARARMERTLAWQRTHDVWTVYEKASRRAIGWAGLEELSPKIWQETGIALGPDYVGRGYGRQILELLVDLARRRGGTEFRCTARAGNLASLGLLRACGFTPTGEEERTDPWTSLPYVLLIYSRTIEI